MVSDRSRGAGELKEKSSEKIKLIKTKLTPEFGPSLVVLAGGQGAHVGERGPLWASLCSVACLVLSPALDHCKCVAGKTDLWI